LSASERGRSTGTVSLGPLPEKIGYSLRVAQVAVFRRFRRAFAEHDIRPAQLGVLTVVGSNPGFKQSEVSAALGIKRSNFGPLLDGLVSRGLIERAKVPSDRRALALHLTDAGARLLEALHQIEEDFEAELTTVVGETGRRDLLDVLRKLQAACSDDGEE
jgi:DNA-binding MarR family transcriptional regulator